MNEYLLNELLIPLLIPLLIAVVVVLAGITVAVYIIQRMLLKTPESPKEILEDLKHDISELKSHGQGEAREREKGFKEIYKALSNIGQNNLKSSKRLMEKTMELSSGLREHINVLKHSPLKKRELIEKYTRMILETLPGEGEIWAEKYTPPQTSFCIDFVVFIPKMDGSREFLPIDCKAIIPTEIWKKRNEGIDLEETDLNLVQRKTKNRALELEKYTRLERAFGFSIMVVPSLIKPLVNIETMQFCMANKVHPIDPDGLLTLVFWIRELYSRVRNYKSVEKQKAIMTEFDLESQKLFRELNTCFVHIKDAENKLNEIITEFKEMVETLQENFGLKSELRTKVGTKKIKKKPKNRKINENQSRGKNLLDFGPDDSKNRC